MKSSLGNLLFAVAVCSLAIGWYLDRTALIQNHTANNQWLTRHQSESELEWKLLNNLHWGHANMDYTLDYIIPKSELEGLPYENKEHFLRMTRLDLRMDDLNVHPISYLAQYENFQHLHTVQLGQQLVNKKTIDCLKRFPALQRIEIWNYGLQIEESDDLIDLTMIKLDEIDVVPGN